MAPKSRLAVDTIERVHGELGRRWIEVYPGRIARCIKHWSLSPESWTESANGAVLGARQANGARVMLKLVIDPDAFAGERTALEVFGGRGAVRLLAADPENGALLLEGVDPGRRLSEVVRDGKDEAATRAAVAVARRLHESEDHGQAARLEDIRSEALATFERYRRERGGTAGPIPVAAIEKAAAQIRDLMASPGRAVVLHGDLHHDNVLSSGREPWLAIDSKGRIGEAECEFAALLRNPIDDLPQVSRPRQFLSRRLDIVAEYDGLDRGRLLAWTQSLGVVAACWGLEDGDAGWDRWLWVADQVR